MSAATSTSASTSTTATERPDTRMAAANLIRFLETGSIPDGLFAPDISPTCHYRTGGFGPRRPKASSPNGSQVARSPVRCG
jgi:hypothetical protein